MSTKLQTALCAMTWLSVWKRRLTDKLLFKFQKPSGFLAHYVCIFCIHHPCYMPRSFHPRRFGRSNIQGRVMNAGDAWNIRGGCREMLGGPVCDSGMHSADLQRRRWQMTAPIIITARCGLECILCGHNFAVRAVFTMWPLSLWCGYVILIEIRAQCRGQFDNNTMTRQMQ